MAQGGWHHQEAQVSSVSRWLVKSPRFHLDEKKQHHLVGFTCVYNYSIYIYIYICISVYIYIYKHLKNDRPTSSLFLTSGNSWGAQTTHASVPRATTRSVADTTVMALPLSSVMVRLDTPGSGAPSQRDVYLHRWKTGKPAGNHGFFACFFFPDFVRGSCEYLPRQLTVVSKPSLW